MPHVKGNKFKPKVVEPPVEDVTDLSLANVADKPTKNDGPPPQKKPRPSKPVIPTVVAPAPKGNTGSKAAATSNWEYLKAAMQQRASPKNSNKKNKKRKGGPSEDQSAAGEQAQLTRLLALDCEMVGVGKRGDRSILARVSLVNSAGAVVYDSFVAPSEPVTDYRTKWSGIRPSQLKGAPAFTEVKVKVQSLLKGRVLVGHALHNDLDVLGIEHPESDLRDTSRYPPLMKTLPGGRIKPRSLRHLAKEHLALAIQAAEHCSIEDARAALGLYQKHKKDWEGWISNGGKMAAPTLNTNKAVPPSLLHLSKNNNGVAMSAERLAELARSDYMADL